MSNARDCPGGKKAAGCVASVSLLSLSPGPGDGDNVNRKTHISIRLPEPLAGFFLLFPQNGGREGKQEKKKNDGKMTGNTLSFSLGREYSMGLRIRLRSCRGFSQRGSKTKKRRKSRKWKKKVLLPTPFSRSSPRECPRLRGILPMPQAVQLLQPQADPSLRWATLHRR